MNTAEKIRLPDDCTIGYIIESVLGVPLTRSNLFHSHLENLQQVSRSEIHKQVRGSSVSEVMNWVCFRVFFLVFFAVMLILTVFYPPDHSQLWDVWKQEQHHQSERGFSCGGGSIKVRDRSVFKGQLHQFLHVKVHLQAEKSSMKPFVSCRAFFFLFKTCCLRHPQCNLAN